MIHKGDIMNTTVLPYKADQNGIVREWLNKTETIDMSMFTNIVGIGTEAFNANKNRTIRRIILPESLRIIEENAFIGLVGLETIVFPKRKIKVVNNPFKNTRWFQSQLEQKGYCSVSGTLIAVKDEKERFFTQEQFDTISATAFVNNQNICAIELSNQNELKIIDGSICECPQLEEVILPNNGKLTMFNNGAFRNNPMLTKINIPTYMENIDAECFIHTGVREKLLSDKGAYVYKNLFIAPSDDDKNSDDLSYNMLKFDNEVDTICSRAFMGTNLSEITLPHSIKYIEEKSFYRCHKLREIEFRDSIKSIGKKAFSECESLELKNLNLGNNTWYDNTSFDFKEGDFFE